MSRFAIAAWMSGSIVLCAPGVAAQEPGGSAGGAPQRAHAQPSGDLSSKVTDPTALLSTITLQNKYIASHWGTDGDANELSPQAALSSHLWGKGNILRLVVPYLSHALEPDDQGLGDVTLLDLVILPQKWGNIAVGPLVSLSRNRGSDVDTFSIGPSIGAVLKRGKWTYGVFNQNLFSFGGDTSISQLQPILAYTINRTMSVSLGDMQLIVDWNRGGKLTSLPLSGQFNYIAHVRAQAIRLFTNPQFSVIDDQGQRKFALTVGFALILQ
jgi:hypothetical protein